MCERGWWCQVLAWTREDNLSCSLRSLLDCPVMCLGVHMVCSALSQRLEFSMEFAL